MNWFKNLKIGVKILVAFSFSVVILIAVGGFSLYRFNELNGLVKEISSSWLPSVRYIGGLNRVKSDIMLKGTQYILSISKEEMEQYKKERDELLQLKDQYENIYSKLIISPKEQELYDKYSLEMKSYLAIQEKIFSLSSQNYNEEAKALSRGEGLNAYNRVATVLSELRTLNEKGSDDAAQTANKLYFYSMVAMLIVILLATGIMFGFGFYLSKAIGNPIKELTLIAERMAKNEIDMELTSDTKDEIGSLMNSFGEMIENLNAIIGDLNMAANEVTSSASQLSDSSQMLSNASTEQAASIEEMTASLNEIETQTKQNAENANQANKMAQNVNDVATHGNEQMKSMLDSMEAINESSKDTSKIIKIIEEIASQTNLLAVNASIEAARVGEHGTGFAVVATEVRNLAAKSAESAQRITTMIEGTIKKVQAGTEIAHSTASALNQIVTGVTKVADLVGEIAYASKEQSSGISQIVSGVTQITQVTSTTAQSAEETAASSEELSGQADIFRNIVGRFKIKNEVQYQKSSLSKSHDGHVNKAKK